MTREDAELLTRVETRTDEILTELQPDRYSLDGGSSELEIRGRQYMEAATARLRAEFTAEELQRVHHHKALDAH
jgi:hypothetical protein